MIKTPETIWFQGFAISGCFYSDSGSDSGFGSDFGSDSDSYSDSGYGSGSS